MIEHKLKHLFPQCGDERVATSITADSRKACPGCIFVAVRGTAVDGHKFIPQAVEAGAVAIVCEEQPAAGTGSAACIVVPDSAQALGDLASAWYGHPSHKLTLVGVTGTNGKTTIATLMYDMARLRGMKAGLLSTVANKIDGTVIPATHTTPDPITIQQLMAQMVEQGCTFCAMEVSSHAAEQKRIAGLDFDGAVFTNLTRDHLDYHKTMANYLAAKKKFFDALKPSAFALANADDKNGLVMMQNTKARKCTYSLQRGADFRCKLIEDRLDGMLISLAISPMAKDAEIAPMATTEVETAFTGRFNAYNLTAVFGACILLGWDREDVLKNLSMLRPVDGRMQTIKSRDGITAVIDYAHTPDAIANVLQAISECSTGRIISVIGAGGNRDAGKRPIMAAEAAKKSDFVVITSDNPRHEDPMEIATQVMEGIEPERRADIAKILVDRAEAIRFALDMAKPGDIVLIAGKGHETYQIIGDESIHFSDREEVEKYIINNK